MHTYNMPYVKTSDAVKEFTSFLPTRSSRKLRMFHYERGLDHVPRCEFTGEECWFSNSGYHGVNRYIFESLVCHDLQINIPLLRYMNLLRAGADPAELIALRDSHYFHKVRNFFNKCSTVEDFLDKLTQEGFNEKSAKDLIGDLRFNSWSSIKGFIDRYYATTNGAKNNHARFYEIRGFTQEEAKKKVSAAANTWEKVKHKIEDKEWHENWCESRRAGLLAQSGRSSKQESELFERLSSSFEVRSHVTVSLRNVNLECKSSVKNKSRAYVDISLQDVIIEYNGSYWHHDFVTYPNLFSINEYQKEIAKLKCIHIASGKRVFVVWESDLKTLKIDTVLDMIKSFILSSESLFGSTREIDAPIFESLK